MESTLSDLRGWLYMDPLIRGTYDVYGSPDGKRLAVVHLQDDEVVVIMERVTGEMVYLHPKTRRGLKRTGLTVQRFTQLVKAMWRDE